MRYIARGLIVVLFAALGASAQAQNRAELAPLAAWVGKGQQKAQLEGRVARALGLTNDERPLTLAAVTTPYLDGARVVHIAQGAKGELLIFAQGKARQGQWMLTDASGTLLRAVQWAPTSARPQPMDAAGAAPLFNETKAFWKNQLGRSAR